MLGRRKHLIVEEALACIPTPVGRRFVTLFEHGTLHVEMYEPLGTGPQWPHTRDEAYIIANVFCFFFGDGQTAPFDACHFLFVRAGVEHRFVGFSDDLAVWVLFYGLEGGEEG